MGGRISGLVCVGALLVAADAEAAPVALLDAPGATAVGLAGGDVLVGRPAARGTARIDAVPIAGGAPRVVARIPRPNPGELASRVVIAASAQRVAAVVEFIDKEGLPRRTQLWIGPPAGPLRREVDAGLRSRGGMPVAVDVDGDRVLVVEATLPTLRFRARVLVPGAAAHVVPLRGNLRPPVALAGDRIAFLGAGAEGPEVRIADWRTGAVLERRADGDVLGLDLAADGRLVAGLRDGPFEAPRFAGDWIVALEPRRFDAVRPVRLDPAGGPPAPLGLPTTELSAFGVDAAGVAWVANGCVLYAPLGTTEPTEPPLGPCPRAEALVEEGDQTLRGRRIRFRAACVTAPAAGCRGTVVVRGEEGAAILGRGSFHVPMGARRRFDVVLTRRGLRYVNAGLRRRHAFLAVRVRTPGGRPAAHGVSGAVVDRRR